MGRGSTSESNCALLTKRRHNSLPGHLLPAHKHLPLSDSSRGGGERGVGGGACGDLSFIKR